MITVPFMQKNKAMLPLDSYILREVGCQRLCVLLKLIFAIIVLLKNETLHCPLLHLNLQGQLVNVHKSP